MRVTTKETVNRRIKDILLEKNTPVTVYAAARIYDLETQCAALLEYIHAQHAQSER